MRARFYNSKAYEIAMRCADGEDGIESHALRTVVYDCILDYVRLAIKYKFKKGGIAFSFRAKRNTNRYEVLARNSCSLNISEDELALSNDIYTVQDALSIVLEMNRIFEDVEKHL